VLRRKRIITAFLGAIAILATMFTADASVASAHGPRMASADRSNVAMAGEPGPLRIESLYSHRCLDRRFPDGYVFGAACSQSDYSEYWVFWNGGFIKNMGSGECLNAGPAGGVLVTSGCDARVKSQLWTQTGSIITLTHSNICLHVVLGTSDDLYASPCNEVSEVTKRWSVTYW
jgi:hypothetical protein